MKISKMIFLLGIASLVIIAVEARANQGWLAQGGCAGYTQKMAPANTAADQGNEEMAPAGSTPDQGNEEMVPANPAPEKGTEELSPAGSTPDQENEEMAPVSPAPQDEEGSSGSY